MTIPKLKDLKKLFSKLSFKKRSQYKTISEKANHDWRVMLIGFACLLIIIIIGSLYMFIGVSQGSLFQTAQTQSDSVEMINQDTLNKTIQSFEDKKANLNALKTTPPQVGDPSL